MDCGGACWSPCDYSRPQLVIGGAMLLEPNTTASFKVTDQFGTEVGQTNVALRNPAGDVTVITTDENGNYNLTNTLSGMWKFTAVKDGYEPGVKNMLAIDISSPQVIAAVAVVVGSTTLLPYLLFWYLYRRRHGIFIEPAAIKLMIESGEIEKISKFMSLSSASEIYPEFAVTGRIRTVRISKGVRVLADDIKARYNLVDDVALSLAFSKKKRTKKVFLDKNIPEALASELKPLEVVSLSG